MRASDLNLSLWTASGLWAGERRRELRSGLEVLILGSLGKIEDMLAAILIEGRPPHGMEAFVLRRRGIISAHCRRRRRRRLLVLACSLIDV
jgi:hypothetical protein